MSRRDDMVETLSSALDTFRSELSSALTAPPPASASSRPPTHPVGRRLSSALANLLDLPTPTPPAPIPGSRSNSVSIPAASSSNHFAPRSAPPEQSLLTSGAAFASTSSHQVLPLPWETEEDEEETPGSEDLPTYSRRPPGTRILDLPPMRLHVLESRSKKLRMEIEAAGEAHVVLLQTDLEGKVWLKGRLVVNLPQAEPVTHIKIRLSGIVRTMVMKVHGSGRHPVTDETRIHEDSLVLYDPTTDPFLPSNESSDPSRLQGTFTFPFRLHIPSRIATLSGPSEAGTAATRRTRQTPPSFVLSGSANDASVGKGAEWASCRYYLKVTLGRRGLLKVNERFIAPVIYIPRHAEPEMSPMRMIAAAEGRPAPGPQEDVAGWKGKKVRHVVKRGVFSGKKAWYECVLLLPTPAAFARLGTLPFAVKLTSSDPNTTTRFPEGSVQVYLVQRAFVAAQGLTNTHDMVVARGIVRPDGPSEGVAVPRDLEGEDEPAVWSKRLSGDIKLVKQVGSSFRAPNLAVQFLVVAFVTVPGTGNNVELHFPVTIVSATLERVTPAPLAPLPLHDDVCSTPDCGAGTFPLRAASLQPPPSTPIPLSAPSTIPFATGSAPIAIPIPQVSATSTASEGLTPTSVGGMGGVPFSPDELGLPPSYFDVVENRRAGGADDD